MKRRAAVLGIGLEHGMRGGAGASEGVENEGVGRDANLKNALQN